jgi:hypothetical protein
MNRAAMGNGVPSTSLVVEHERGSLFASLRFARVRKRRLEFALTVVNTSDRPLLTTTYALTRHGAEMHVEPFSVWIDARTEAYVNVPLEFGAALRARALIVRLRGQGIDERVEADVPQPYGLWAAGAALLAIAALFGIIWVRPTLGFFDVDRNATANTTLNARYAFGGAAHGVWELTEIDGRHVNGGELTALRGTLPVHLPQANDRKIYLLRLRADGRFGSASADRVIFAQTPRP